MTQQNPGWSPMTAYVAVASAWLDAVKASQETITDSLDRTARGDHKMVDWVTFEVPVPNARSAFDEEQMRDSFHRLADMNLRGWEVAANMLQALPGWANWPSRAPGTMMTDWFDRMRRASVSMMPANDSFAMPDGFKSPMFWAAAGAAAPKGPQLMDAPEGEADDLTAIKGIGPKLSDMLNELGIYHYRQIAAWSEADGEWIDDKLAFKGRVAREDWIEQARRLAEKAAA